MIPKLSNKEARRGFIQRTREARAALGISAAEMARRLGIDQGTYKNYETNRPLPEELVWPFCLEAEIEPNDLFARPAALRRYGG